MFSKPDITKVITIVLLVIFLFINSSYSSNTPQKRKNSTITFLPDTTISNKLVLRDALSTKAFYNSKIEVFPESVNNEFPVVYFSNIDSSEYLAAYIYHGDSKNQFSVFEVGYCSNLEKSKNANFIYTQYTSFTTENDIHLKMGVKELLNLKGINYSSIVENSRASYTYRLDDYEHSPFLKRYNMPVYFSEYVFKNEEIIMFKFGFEYP